jgi:hypothetical protein
MWHGYNHLVWRAWEVVAALPFLPRHSAWMLVTAGEAGRLGRFSGGRCAQRLTAVEVPRPPLWCSVRVFCNECGIISLDRLGSLLGPHVSEGGWLTAQFSLGPKRRRLNAREVVSRGRRVLWSKTEGGVRCDRVAMFAVG